MYFGNIVLWWRKKSIESINIAPRAHLVSFVLKSVKPPVLVKLWLWFSSYCDDWASSSVSISWPISCRNRSGTLLPSNVASLSRLCCCTRAIWFTSRLLSPLQDSQFSFVVAVGLCVFHLVAVGLCVFHLVAVGFLCSTFSLWPFCVPSSRCCPFCVPSYRCCPFCVPSSCRCWLFCVPPCRCGLFSCCSFVPQDKSNNNNNNQNIFICTIYSQINIFDTIQKETRIETQTPSKQPSSLIFASRRLWRCSRSRLSWQCWSRLVQELSLVLSR